MPPDVKDMLEAGEFETAIRPWPAVPSIETIETGDGTVVVVNEDVDLVTNQYGRFWKDLLYASEYQMSHDIELFDLYDAELKKLGRNLFLLPVPGLSEGRPSVLRGDLVFVTWNRRLYKGRVLQVRLLEIVLEFHRTFTDTFHPAVDRADVIRFTFSRMAFGCMHEACDRAEFTMRETLLLPNAQIQAQISMAATTTEHANARNVGSSSDGSFRSWANRDLNDEQRLAVRIIVVGKLRPLPYIIFGPPGTGAFVSAE